jgi:hypothetical protein
MRHALRKNERAVVASTQDLPAVPERSPKQQERTTEQKSREREEQSLHIAQTGARSRNSPKTHFSEPTIPQPEAAKSAAGFLIRAALTPSTGSIFLKSYFVAVPA